MAAMTAQQLRAILPNITITPDQVQHYVLRGEQSDESMEVCSTQSQTSDSSFVTAEESSSTEGVADGDKEEKEVINAVYVRCILLK